MLNYNTAFTPHFVFPIGYVTDATPLSSRVQCYSEFSQNSGTSLPYIRNYLFVRHSLHHNGMCKSKLRAIGKLQKSLGSSE